MTAAAADQEKATPERPRPGSVVSRAGLVALAAVHGADVLGRKRKHIRPLRLSSRLRKEVSAKHGNPGDIVRFKDRVYRVAKDGSFRRLNAAEAAADGSTSGA